MPGTEDRVEREERDLHRPPCGSWLERWLVRRAARLMSLARFGLQAGPPSWPGATAPDGRAALQPGAAFAARSSPLGSAGRRRGGGPCPAPWPGTSRRRRRRAGRRRGASRPSRRRCRCSRRPRPCTPATSIGSLSAAEQPLGDRRSRTPRRGYRSAGRRTRRHRAAPRDPFAQVVAQPRGDRDQQLVAGGVAEAVVDRLEVVEVEEQRGHRARAAARPARAASAALDEPAAVGQAGQRVVEGLEARAVPRARGAWRRRARASRRDRPAGPGRAATAARSRPRRPPARRPRPGRSSTRIGPVTMAAASQTIRTGPSHVTATGCGSVSRRIDGCSAAAPKRR